MKDKHDIKLPEYEAKAYLEAAYPEFKGNIEMQDKPDLRIKTASGEIGVEVVASYPKRMIQQMLEEGEFNIYENTCEYILNCFCKKQQKVKEYNYTPEIRLFILSGCPCLCENTNNLDLLLNDFLHKSDGSFQIVYVMALNTLYEFDLTNRKYHVVKELEETGMRVRKELSKKYTVVFEISAIHTIYLSKHIADKFTLRTAIAHELMISNDLIKEDVGIDIINESVDKRGHYTAKIRWHDFYSYDIEAISKSDAKYRIKRNIKYKHPSINLKFKVMDISVEGEDL